MLESIFNKYSSQPHFPALKIQLQLDKDTYLFQTKFNSVTLKDLTGNEAWHIGSCGKSLTAHLISKLTEEGILFYDDRVLNDISLADLLTHSSGIPDEYPDIIWKDMISEAQSDHIKRDLIFEYWSHFPNRQPKRYFYSNWNYVIAATYASRCTRLPFEELMNEYVFAPMDLSSAGFGAPGISRPYEALWGHIEHNGKIVPIEPGPIADNPQFFSPAGGIHLSGDDWAKFIKSQIESSGRLHLTPASSINTNLQYLATGWIKDDTTSLSTYSHTGCNKLWTASATFIPKKNTFWTIQTNCGSSCAVRLIQQASQEIRSIVSLNL